MTRSTSKPFELLQQIARLLDQFGPDAFGDLAEVLSDPDLTQDIVAVLSEVASRAPRKTRSKRKRPSAAEVRVRFRASLTELREAEPDRGGKLLELYDLLESKSALPTLRELLAFISDHGQDAPRAKSREKVVMAFLKNCMSLPDEEIGRLLAEARPDQERGDRTLEDWGRVILNGSRDGRAHGAADGSNAEAEHDGREGD